MTSGKEVSNKQVLFKRYVVGWPTKADMELVTTTMKLELKEGSKEVLVKVLYLSCDSGMRRLMIDSADHYFHPFQPGHPMSGLGVGKVILSSDQEFVENEYVSGRFDWEEYSLGSRLHRIDPSVVRLTCWPGALGNA